MAYTEAEKKSHVAEIQRMLRFLSFIDNEIPRIIPDGIYGPETTKAVEAFQRLRGLDVTGSVDRLTWDTLVRDYRQGVAQGSLELLKPRVENAIYLGSKEEVVMLIQLILRGMARDFINLGAPPLSGVYDNDTRNAVAVIQTLALIEPTGMVDSETWNLMAKVYNVI